MAKIVIEKSEYTQTYKWVLVDEGEELCFSAKIFRRKPDARRSANKVMKLMSSPKTRIEEK